MGKKLARFRGSLEESFSFNKITKTKIDYLLEKKIIVHNEYIDKEKAENIFWPGDEIFGILFFFNKNVYSINNDIIQDMYDLTLYCIKSKYYITLHKEMNQIRIKCRSLIDRPSKINYLKSYHENLFKNLSDFDNYEDFIDEKKTYLLFSCVASSDNNNFFELVKFYLQSREMKEATYGVIDEFTNEKYPFIAKWNLYHKTRTLETFILEMINYLEPSDHNDEKKDSLTQTDQKSKTLKSQTPLYQVLFIDILRKLKNESYYSDDNLEKYLGHLTGYDFKDKSFQIDTLKNIIHLKDFEYKKLSATELGDKIHDITNKDRDSLRRNSAVITKKQKNHTKTQKEKFKDKYELESKIRRVIKTLG